MKQLTTTLLLLASFWSLAQNTSLSSGEILQAMKKLNTVGSVLYVAAHPDDENTRLLAYLANEKKVRTGYLSLTRGDGGQNLIGKEQGELLGLIRTQELLAARRVDGAEQFFTRANDFGFSKNPEETFGFWNKDSILWDVVLAIRKFKPDVIICRFPTTGEGGHGHHTASAILALEAFDAAADPKRFPEQLSYTNVWQARRIFWNTFNFGTTNTTSPDQLKIDVGLFNPLLGKSYGEIAAESRSMHKSQGFGSAKQRGSSIEYFKLLKGDSAKTDLMEQINTGWSRYKGQEKLQKMMEDCIVKFNASAPENSVNDLIAIYKQLQLLDNKDPMLNYWKEIKLKETENLILACAGLWFETTATEAIVIPGQNITYNMQFVLRNKADVKLDVVAYTYQDSAVSLTLKQNEFYSFKHTEALPTTISYSNPYWLNEKHEAGTYTILNKSLIGKPENSAPLKNTFAITINGLKLNIIRPVVYKSTDPVKGEVYKPLEILPPATVNIPEKVFVFTDTKPKNIQLTVKVNTANISGKLELAGNKDWNIVIKNPEFKLTNKGDEALIEATITAKANAAASNLKASVTIDGKAYTKNIKRIEYDHIPYQFMLSDAEAGLVYIDLKKTNTNIAYIPGAGDDVAACLKQVGYNVTTLTDEQLSNADLSSFQAIVTGVRAYNTNERLQVHYQKLMDYVKNGGNLIVQYNTNSRVGPLQAKIGPYPFNISRDRVTNEKAEVTFVNDKHSVLHTPNIITSNDFEGWIQERGIYFASDIDKQYETILSMNDPGEKANEGSLIIGKYGKGNFVYTGLVFFRELPAGIPGAYRLFANLISLPQNPAK